MGHDKALLDRGGQSQLGYLTALLGRFVDKVFVSTRPGQAQDKERRQYQQIVDRFIDIGPIAGILSALLEHPDVDWLVVACDLPNIDARTIQYLLSHRKGEQAFTAYRSSHDGLPEPLCALYHSSCREVVQRFVDEGLHCPRKVLIRSETRLLEQADGRVLENVNTPDDLKNSILQARQ